MCPMDCAVVQCISWVRKPLAHGSNTYTVEFWRIMFYIECSDISIKFLLIGTASYPNRGPYQSWELAPRYFRENKLLQGYTTNQQFIKYLVCPNVRCTITTVKLKLTVCFWKLADSPPRTTSSSESDLQRKDLVFEWKCNTGKCEFQHISYIGMMTSAVSRMFTVKLESKTTNKYMKIAQLESLDFETSLRNTKLPTPKLTVTTTKYRKLIFKIKTVTRYAVYFW